jgi:hypothetical protein
LGFFGFFWDCYPPNSVIRVGKNANNLWKLSLAELSWYFARSQKITCSILREIVISSSNGRANFLEFILGRFGWNLENYLLLFGRFVDIFTNAPYCKIVIIVALLCRSASVLDLESSNCSAFATLMIGSIWSLNLHVKVSVNSSFPTDSCTLIDKDADMLDWLTPRILLNWVLAFVERALEWTSAHWDLFWHWSLDQRTTLAQFRSYAERRTTLSQIFGRFLQAVSTLWPPFLQLLSASSAHCSLAESPICLCNESCKLRQKLNTGGPPYHLGLSLSWHQAIPLALRWLSSHSQSHWRKPEKSYEDSP